jgi:glycosyltransferase involved in cell wall biosynthesis
MSIVEPEVSRMRVCFAVDAAQPGGAERYISLLALGLDRRVFDPVVLARRGVGLDAWCAAVAASGVTVVRAPMDMPFRPDHAVPVLAALRRIEPRIVHVNMPGPYDGQMGLMAPLARLAGAAGVVVTEHLPRVETLWKRAVVKAVSYQWVDRVLTVCRANVPYLVGRQRVPEHKVGVVYNGIPASYGSVDERARGSARRDLGLDGGRLGIVYVERKGLGVLLDALGGVAGDEWTLIVVGTGERETAFRRRASERGLEGRVRFLGGLPESGVEGVLRGADLLVLPSFIEGMPYVILEAMACSLPVVATTVDGIPEAAPHGEAGLLVPPGDAAALRAAIQRLLEDAPFRRELGENGRRRFERLFTLDRHLAEMESVYAGIAAAPGR